MVRNFVLHARLAFPDPVNRFIFIVDSVLQPFTGVWNQYVQIFEGEKINITGLLNKLAFINRDWFNLSIWMATLLYSSQKMPHRLYGRFRRSPTSISQQIVKTAYFVLISLHNTQRSNLLHILSFQWSFVVGTSYALYI